MSRKAETRTADARSLAAQLGISEAEAREMKRRIQFCECNGPQRYVITGRIQIERVKHADAR